MLLLLLLGLLLWLWLGVCEGEREVWWEVGSWVVLFGGQDVRDISCGGLLSGVVSHGSSRAWPGGFVELGVWTVVEGHSVAT